MCLFNKKNDFYISILKDEIISLENRIDDYENYCSKQSEKLRYLNTYIENRKIEYLNANKDSKSCINEWHYKMLLDKIEEILRGE